MSGPEYWIPRCKAYIKISLVLIAFCLALGLLSIIGWVLYGGSPIGFALVALSFVWVEMLREWRSKLSEWKEIARLRA